MLEGYGKGGGGTSFQLFMVWIFVLQMVALFLREYRIFRWWKQLEEVQASEDYPYPGFLSCSLLPVLLRHEQFSLHNPTIGCSANHAFPVRKDWDSLISWVSLSLPCLSLFPSKYFVQTNENIINTDLQRCVSEWISFLFKLIISRIYLQ